MVRVPSEKSKLGKLSTFMQANVELRQSLTMCILPGPSVREMRKQRLKNKIFNLGIWYKISPHSSVSSSDYCAFFKRLKVPILKAPWRFPLMATIL